MSTSRNLGDLIGTIDDRAALIDLSVPAGPVVYTRNELDAMARGVARALVGRGLGRGDRIGILAANSGEYVAAFLGAMRAGIVPVPINIKLPAASVDFIVHDAEIRLMLADADRAALSPAGIPLVRLGAGGADGFAAFLDHGLFESVQPRPDEIAFVLYTSGSTGRAKGVPLSHAGQKWAIEARSRFVKDMARHRILIAAPMFHMNGLFGTKVALRNDATIVLLPQFTVDTYLAAIAAYRCTWITSVPTMIALILQSGPALATTDTSSVEIVTMGSAPITEGLIERVRRQFPGATIFNNYGTTEAGPAVFGPHPGGLPRPALSMGYPLADVAVRLVAADGRKAEEGVLQLKTPALMAGYLNLPEATRSAFTPDGWYVTGDVMRRDAEGFYFFVGRADDMFKCGGESVYPIEVELMLERHPGVRQACVVPVPDGLKGYKPVAFVVPGDPPAGEAEIKAFALANAPAYQHPRRVFFLDRLPLSGVNKIDRKALTARAGALVEKETEVSA